MAINQLPATSFTPAKFAMEAVSPRPDGETGNPYYRYYHADMAYKARVAVRGGAWPFYYDLTTAPAGATIGNNYGDADYGVVSWASPTGASESFSVTVTDQSGNTLIVAWTATLAADDASRFVFVDADVAGPGTGTFADPLSDIDDLSSGHADKIAVLRDSASQYAPTSDVNLANTTYPSTLMGFYGESPILDGAGGKIRANEDDTAIINLILDGSEPLTNNATHSIKRERGDRFLVWDCTFRNQDIGGGNQSEGNPTCVYLPDVSGTPSVVQKYIAVVDCTQESSSLTPFSVFFTSESVLIENNTIQDNDLSAIAVPPGAANTGITARIYMKDRPSKFTIRANSIIAPSGTGDIIGVAQQNNGGTVTDQEVCWNTVVGNANTGRELGLVTWGLATAGATVPPNMFQYRNSVVVTNTRIPMAILNYSGVYTNDLLIEDELWSTDDTLYVTANKGYGDEGGRYDGTSDSPLSNDGTPDELFSYGAVQPLLLDAADVDANGLLTGSARTTYLGIAGAEVDTASVALSTPVGTPTGTTTAIGSVNTNKSSGTLYWEVTESATPTSPNATFISDATTAGDTQTVTASGSQLVSVTGLTSATSYYVHFLHVDAEANESNIATSAQFTTQSLTAPTLEQGIMNPNLPVIDSTGSTLTLTFSEAVTTSAATGLTLSTGETLTYSSGSTTDTIVYTISPYAQEGGGGEILNFAGGANVIEATVGGTDVEAFSDALVSSQSTATAPVVVGDPTVDETGTLLTVVFSSASLANQTTPAHSPFTLTGTLGGVYTFTNAAIPANTGVFTISPAVEYNDVLSLSFTQAGGTFTDGTTGIELATFTDAVVNNTSSTDNEPPVFTAAPDKVKTTISGHTIRQTINETGNVYGVRLPIGSGIPSAAQVKAGTDSLGAAAPEAKNVAAVAGQSCSFIFSTGEKNTTYDYYIVAEDSVPNLQETVVQLTATTDNLLFNGSGQGLPAAAPKKKVKMKWDDKKKRR